MSDVRQEISSVGTAINGRSVGSRLLVGMAIGGMILSATVYMLSFTNLSWSGDIAYRLIGARAWHRSLINVIWIVLIPFSLIVLGSQFLLFVLLARWALARGPDGRHIALSRYAWTRAGARVYRSNLRRFLPRRAVWLVGIVWFFFAASLGIDSLPDSKRERGIAQNPGATSSAQEERDRARSGGRRLDRIVGAGGLAMYGTMLIACLYVDPRRHLLYVTAPADRRPANG